MDHGTATKEAEASKRVNDARNQLNILRENKEKFLEERETEANEHLQEVNDATETANGFIGKVTKEIEVLGDTLNAKYTTFLDALASLLDLAKGIAEKTDDTNRALTKAKEHLERRCETLDILIQEANDFAKDLKTRDKEVELKLKKADAKLQKAKDIAYWHKNGGVVYTDKKDD